MRERFIARDLSSCRPSILAEAPLDVASARKPKPASRRAELASHGFGMTKAPGD